MPLSIQAAERGEKTEGKREAELLPGLTTWWPSEAEGAKRSEGGQMEGRRSRQNDGGKKNLLS